MTCSITNLGECLPEVFFNYLLTIINAPLEGLLAIIQTFLSEPPPISLFSTVWSIIIYIISMFYGLLLVYAGINLIVSGYSPVKREEAKSWLKNIIIMVLLIQSSFLIYSLLLDISTALTASIFNLIDANTFLLTIDNFVSIGTEITYTLLYLIILALTVLILILRYLIVAFGVVLFPIGIFLYFIIPLRSYGKALLNFLAINIFSSFLASLIILMGSLFATQTIFSNMNIMLMCAVFLCVDFVLIYLLIFMVISFQSVKRTVINTAKTVAVVAA